jgi:hypothetical protein
VYRNTLVPSHHVGSLSDSPTAPSRSTRAVGPVIIWIATNTIPIKNRIQEIWTVIADTPARFRAPAIKPTTKNTSA